MIDFLQSFGQGFWHYFSNLTNLVGLFFVLMSFKPKKAPMDKSNYFNYWIALWLTASRPETWAKVFKYFRMDEMDKVESIEKSDIQPRTKKATNKMSVEQLTLWASFVTSVVIPTTNFIMAWFDKLSGRTQKIIVILTFFGLMTIGVWYFFLRQV